MGAEIVCAECGTILMVTADRTRIADTDDISPKATDISTRIIYGP